MVNFNNKKVFEVVVKRLNNVKFKPLTNTHFINNSNLKKVTEPQTKKIEMHESHSKLLLSKTPFIKKH